MVLRILGIVLAVWIVFAVLGAVFKFLGTALVIGVLALLGVGVYHVVRGRSRRQLP